MSSRGAKSPQLLPPPCERVETLVSLVCTAPVATSTLQQILGTVPQGARNDGGTSESLPLVSVVVETHGVTVHVLDEAPHWLNQSFAAPRVRFLGVFPQEPHLLALVLSLKSDGPMVRRSPFFLFLRSFNKRNA